MPEEVRVALAEDDAIIRLDLRETLEEEGYTVVGDTGRGDEMLELVAATDPEVVILDIKMPGMDGIEALEIEVEPLEAVTDPRAAFAPDAPLVHEQFGSNQVVDWETGDSAAVADAFAGAAHITTLELVNNRIAGSPTEPVP